MEGVAAPEAIDTVMKLGMAHPMGPLQLADFIGLDVCLAILEVLHRGLGDDKYRPAPLLRRMVAAGYLGRKSGRGFYDYRETKSSMDILASMHALRPRAGAAVARPELRLLRHHRDPRHHARPGARRHPLLALRLHRRGHHRRAPAGARHDLQVGRGGHQSGRRQVRHRGRQQAARPRGAVPRARPLHRDPGRPLHHGGGHRHEPGGHGVHQARDRPRGRPRRPLGRPVAGDGVRRVRRA